MKDQQHMRARRTLRQRAAPAAHEDAILDRALAATFPASDPVAINHVD